MNNQWSDNLRKRMETHQEPSPEGLWEGIEQIMQEENSIKPLSKKKKVLLWSKRVAAVAAIAVIVCLIGYYMISNQDQENIQLAIETPEKQDTPDIEMSIPDQEITHISKSDSRLFSEKVKTQTKKSIQAKEISAIDTIKLIAQEESIHEEVTKDNLSESDSRFDRAENKRFNSNKNQSLDFDPEFDLFTNKHKDESARWAANLYASNLSSGSTSKYNGYGSLSQYATEPQGCEEEPLPRENPYGEILIQNKYREVYTDVKHRQPITMGVSVNYRLDERWSLTSGLTYTILSSDLRSGSDNYYYNSEQTLHNIGIPLNINYNIWRNKRLSIYVSGGGLAEKNVSGKLTTNYIVDKELESSKKENISIDQLQWSVNTSAGLQYNLSKQIGLYVEPGVSYYFKNGSEIETIYKEKPLNISLRFGLSLSLGGK